MEAGMERQPCVYLLANKPNGTLYTGVTSNLVKRVWEHKQHFVEGFTRKYGVDRLVWYEVHESMISAISREKAIKKWNRAWKVKTIEAMNPEWRDLYEDMVGGR
jgi:putative endonuclease